MDIDAIVPGVGIGGLTDKYDIKILVCYLLNSVQEKLTKKQIDCIIQDGQYVNYFSYCMAFSELLDSKHISFVDDNDSNPINLHEIGVATSRKLESNLPISLRDNVVSSAIRILAKLKKERENEATIEKYQNGYKVKCTIHDTDFDLLSFEMFMPDMLQSEKIKEKFHANPTEFYKKMVDFLMDFET